MTHTDFGRTYTGHPIESLSEKLIERVKRLRRRRKFKNLLDLDDQMLDDIGVVRAEVQIAANLPLSVDAATELRRMSLERRKQKM